jgi:hypothetical protein
MINAAANSTPRAIASITNFALSTQEVMLMD